MAIKPIEIFNQLNKQGIEFFTGVPDSLLKEFCLCIDDKAPASKHIIAANEGSAVSIGIGYYLSTKK